jgi:hypothetical protein
MADRADPAVLPLAVLILSVLSFVFTPINNTLVRTQEYEADIFGLNSARQPMASQRRRCCSVNTASPLEEFLLFDHPSGRTRIYSAIRWKAENQCLGDAIRPCGRSFNRGTKRCPKSLVLILSHIKATFGEEWAGVRHSGAHSRFPQSPAPREKYAAIWIAGRCGVLGPNPPKSLGTL